jgi:hypothetical protein
VHVVPACEKVTVLPLMETEPRSAFAFVFGWFGVMPTIPFPVPDRGVTVAHGVLVAAVHEQPAGALTLIVPPVTPADANGLPSPDVSRLTLQVWPICVIENGCPPISKVPDWLAVVEF